MIVLDLSNISIKVVTTGGKTLTVQVDPDNDVQSIKDALEQENLDPESYTLKLKGKPLEDDDKIFKTGIKEGTTLTMD